ncbi:NAD(P)/FAD-dependent oxidoreductase [Rosenbergiella epipactidis]|uniref:NAD(P)/FAD-dependent oxidoreductase n=1 Tax=Rosenbergiella epipactidis TaxID=1544694 RepID=UPI001F4D4CFF|nr:NAD(P)/FAD-dependent oxidoreductase [Rosenbergiella epipactidis]
MNTSKLVVIVGAGPSGTVAAALLKKNGHNVIIVEKQAFPRFSIGESLLCSCLDDLEKAGLLGVVEKAGFQVKTGAAFQHNNHYTEFNFSENFTAGKQSTYQVERAIFDKILADEVIELGVDIRFGEQVEDISFERGPELLLRKASGEKYTLKADFILDASGYGRVLPRILGLEIPSRLENRRAIFTHINDQFIDKKFDREKILITTHATNPEIWFWTIPFTQGKSSLGVVVPESLYVEYQLDNQQFLNRMINETPSLRGLLEGSQWNTPINTLSGYSAKVKSFHGKYFALLGNAAEFLDPVFSSGVTIAVHSATLAAELLHQQFSGNQVDWEKQYDDKLKIGINCFRTYVENWYNRRFQNIIYYHNPDPKIKAMICSILAGYAWDITNPFVQDSERKFNQLANLCQDSLDGAHNE